jgi:hypothetical protein
MIKPIHLRELTVTGNSSLSDLGVVQRVGILLTENFTVV